MAKQTWKAQSVSVRVGGRKDEEELFESSWSKTNLFCYPARHS